MEENSVTGRDSRAIGAVWRVIGPGNEVVAQVKIEDWRTADKRPPAEIVEAVGVPGRGYHVCWSPISPARKQWSREARARNRVRRLRERMERKYPLFAEMFIEERLAADSEYYEGRHPVYDAGRPG